MMRRFAGALVALMCLVAPSEAAPVAKTIPAPFCKTLKGEWVGFGEDGTRGEAESRLDQELANWGKRYSITPVKPKDRKVGCRVYMEVLNEYFCTAEAVVCR
jgi:hypothetical protein